MRGRRRRKKKKKGKQLERVQGETHGRATERERGVPAFAAD